MEGNNSTTNNIIGSRTVSRAAILMCTSRSREEEKELKQQFHRQRWSDGHPWLRQ